LVKAKARSRILSSGLLLINPGDFLLSHAVSRAVPSAPAGLTSVFGMGTGVTLPTKSPENLLELCTLIFVLCFYNEAQRTKYKAQKSNSDRQASRASASACCLSKFYGQAMGLISSGQLNALLRLHIHPITSWSTRSLTGRSNLGSGFTLRCIQRLSMLHLATERYGWRHNSYTRGGSIPVLSY
jgi:hypothetical protein